MTASTNTTPVPVPAPVAGERGSPAPLAGLSRATLDTLAARMRPGGLFLMLVAPDGRVVYHDSGSAPFFLRMVLPAIQPHESAVSPLQVLVKAQHPASSVEVWRNIPGVAIAAVPVLERRAVGATVLLAGKSQDFRLGEEVLRLSGSLGLDGVWLAQQADQTPGYTPDALQREARLLLGMIRDQQRLVGLEQELETLSGQLSNTYEELSLIYQLSGGMKVNRSAVDFFQTACQDVLAVMDVRGMGVILHGDGALKQPPSLYGAVHLPPEVLNRTADTLMAVFRRRSGALQINRLDRDAEFGFLSQYARQLLAVPLTRQEQVLGCLFAFDKASDEFNSVDSKLLTSIANESAIYLENAMLFDDVHGLMMGLLHSLTSAVDAKDAYTFGHSERVALLSRHLALAANMSDADADRVYMAGLLHDVGKIGVPEAVLQKTGRLTNEEFEQIKKHPAIGARILGDIKQIEDVIPGVMHHHERYDGKGYPSGLAGENIPWMGRVICLADCFDAMTSSRTYRRALPLEVAMIEIRRCAGTQFDPILADAFLRISTDELRDLLKNHAASTRRVLDLQQSLRAA